MALNRLRVHITGEEPPQTAKELFSIKFHSHEQEMFGARYNFQMNDGKSTQQFFLVHTHTLMELALVYGLEMVEMTNMASFYQDNSYYFAELLKEQGVLAGDATSRQMNRCS